MLCPACGNQNRDEARFCDSCGTPLEEPGTQSGGVAAPTATAPAPDTPKVIEGRFRGRSLMRESSGRQAVLARDERDEADVGLTLFSPELMVEGALARSRRE